MKNINTAKLPLKHKHLKNSSRRGFLKKAAYAAPTIVALGALMKPKEAEANLSNPKPPSGPRWNP